MSFKRFFNAFFRAFFTRFSCSVTIARCIGEIGVSPRLKARQPARHTEQSFDNSHQRTRFLRQVLHFFIMEGMTRFELALSVWKTGMLTIKHYIPKNTYLPKLDSNQQKEQCSSTTRLISSLCYRCINCELKEYTYFLITRLYVFV